MKYHSVTVLIYKLTSQINLFRSLVLWEKNLWNLDKLPPLFFCNLVPKIWTPCRLINPINLLTEFRLKTRMKIPWKWILRVMTRLSKWVPGEWRKQPNHFIQLNNQRIRRYPRLESEIYNLINLKILKG